MMKGFWLNCWVTFSIGVAITAGLCRTSFGVEEETEDRVICQYWQSGAHHCMDTNELFDCPIAGQLCNFDPSLPASEKTCGCRTWPF
jgi:hypothetical protein